MYFCFTTKKNKTNRSSYAKDLDKISDRRRITHSNDISDFSSFQLILLLLIE